MLFKYQDILDIGMRPDVGTGHRRSIPGECTGLYCGPRPLQWVLLRFVITGTRLLHLGGFLLLCMLLTNAAEQ